MKIVLVCVFSLVQLLNAKPEGGSIERVQLQDPVVKDAQEKYEKMKVAVMLDLNNEVTFVNMSYIKKPDQPDSNNTDADYIGFYYYEKNNPKNPTKYTLRNITSAIDCGSFNKTKKTVFLVHGYLNNVNSPMIQKNKDALLSHQDVNVIAVDWYQAMAKFKNIYNLCASITLTVGEDVGLALSQLIDGGLNPDLIHLVGHSLGAHVVGVAGRFLNDRNQTIGRITGLDPAKIDFMDVPIPSIINAGDAKYVDCIHTCGSYLAFDRPLCQTDFYPNGGLVQPGCSFLSDICCVCSHGRSYLYFAESVLPKHTFPTRRCVWSSKTLMGCTDSPQLMGYPANPDLKGTFFVETQADYPFSPVQPHPPQFNLWDFLKAWLTSISITNVDSRPQ